MYHILPGKKMDQITTDLDLISRDCIWHAALFFYIRLRNKHIHRFSSNIFVDFLVQETMWRLILNLLHFCSRLENKAKKMTCLLLSSFCTSKKIIAESWSLETKNTKKWNLLGRIKRTNERRDLRSQFHRSRISVATKKRFLA